MSRRDGAERFGERRRHLLIDHPQDRHREHDNPFWIVLGEHEYTGEQLRERILGHDFGIDIAGSL